MSTPSDLRKKIREKIFKEPTPGLCPGYVQTNLIIIENEYASDFESFCNKNPKPCPLIAKFNTHTVPSTIANDSDIRTDLGKYRIYKHGIYTDELDNIKELWRDNFSVFLIGCSFTFENALIESGIKLRHIDENKNVSMYITNIKCEKSEKFECDMVVSMRPIKKNNISKVIEITRKFPDMHGDPVHVGNPEEIGIFNMEKPDFGDFVEVKEDEIPVFWGCGVTPQLALKNAKLPLSVSHSPGYMFITDLLESKYFVDK